MLAGNAEGWRVCAAPFFSLIAGAALFLFPQTSRATSLEVSLAETGKVLAEIDLSDRAEWCVLWRHSVKGFEVQDCYEMQNGQMVLVWSHLPDFAAGLDHIIGRGRQISDGQGGYIIEDINEPVAGNAYILRPGSMAVDHRIQAGATEISLSRMAEHQRVRIALIP
ncbi:DUF1850 domain-containing protein [Rhodobacterales bacterium LSUCC0387]|nr:DUF1850 domain-containing protein [Rhodobacterales bacterium LSUCC0387]